MYKRWYLSFLRSIRPTLRYFFYPNPGNVTYGSPSMIALLALSVGLIVLSFVLRSWRAKLTNPITKKLSRSWSSVSFWFGVTGVVLVVSRVEQIQFFAMRFFWFLWLVSALVYIWFQWRQFRARHYRVLPTMTVDDPRERYLPKRRK
jgi:hypothetical protein